MSIIVETGAGVENANSYNSSADAKAYADARGLLLPCQEDDLDPLNLRAMDYIESFSDRYQGSRVLDTQALSFPREGVYIDCVEQASDSIPKELTSAHVEVMIALHGGFNPWESFKVEPYVTEETLGPMRIRYAKSGDFDGPAYAAPRLRAVNAFLSKLLTGGSSEVKFVKP